MVFCSPREGLRNLGLLAAPALRSLTSLSTFGSFAACSGDWLDSFSFFLSPAILCKLFSAASSISFELSLSDDFDFEADTEKDTELVVDFSTSFSSSCGLLISLAFPNLRGSFCFSVVSFTTGAGDGCGLEGTLCLSSSTDSFFFCSSRLFCCSCSLDANGGRGNGFFFRRLPPPNNRRGSARDEDEGTASVTSNWESFESSSCFFDLPLLSSWWSRSLLFAFCSLNTGGFFGRELMLATGCCLPGFSVLSGCGSAFDVGRPLFSSAFPVTVKSACLPEALPTDL